MVFELEADGVRALAPRTFWTRKLVSKGAKLVDARQAEYLGGRILPSGTLRRATGAVPLGLPATTMSRPDSSPRWRRDGVDVLVCTAVLLTILISAVS
jgi:hypothetical protein